MPLRHLIVLIANAHRLVVRFHQEAPTDRVTFYNPAYSTMPSTCSIGPLLRKSHKAFARYGATPSSSLAAYLKTSFSRLNPVPRGQATVIRSSVRSLQRRPTTRDKPLAQFTLTIQSDKLPSYLRPLLRFQPARPSTIS